MQANDLHVPMGRLLILRLRSRDALLRDRSPALLKNALDNASRRYGQSAWAGKPAGVIGTSVCAIGTALALRNILAYLDVPTLGQPEAFIQAKDGLFDTDGSIGSGSRQFLQDWMNHYVAWVKHHAG
jgi:chromate reductase